MSQTPIIPYAHQSIRAEDLEAVQTVLRGDWLTQGPAVLEFETGVAKFCGAKYAVSFCNGTAALHAAVKALGLKPGDEGIVPAITFAATANCLLYEGASPVFSDVTSGIPQMNPADVAKKITQKTKALIPVHFAGDVAPLKMLHNLANTNSLALIEDACHAFGSEFYDPDTQKRHRVGSCLYSDMTVFSFHPVKNITTGEGGLITTNRTDLFEKLKKFRHHGITLPDPSQSRLWDYSIDELGMNYRLTDIQAALGLSQLKRVDALRDQKICVLNRYLEAFAGQEKIRFLLPEDLTFKHLHLCLAQVALPQWRDALFTYLRERGILAQVHYKPLYRHPLYQKGSMPDLSAYPGAEAYFERSITLPLYADLSWESQDRVIDTISAFLKDRT